MAVVSDHSQMAAHAEQLTSLRVQVAGMDARLKSLEIRTEVLPRLETEVGLLKEKVEDAAKVGRDVKNAILGDIASGRPGFLAEHEEMVRFQKSMETPIKYITAILLLGPVIAPMFYFVLQHWVSRWLGVSP